MLTVALLEVCEKLKAYIGIAIRRIRICLVHAPIRNSTTQKGFLFVKNDEYNFEPLTFQLVYSGGGIQNEVSRLYSIGRFVLTVS